MVREVLFYAGKYYQYELLTNGAPSMFENMQELNKYSL